MKSTRQEVYKSIDGERTYQGERWNDNGKELLDFLAYIKDYTLRAIETERRHTGSQINCESARNDIRKIAALSVAALERFGTIMRPGFDR